MGLGINVPVKILLSNIEVLEFLLHERVVGHRLVLEALAPHVGQGHSEVLWWVAGVFQLFLDGQGLVHGRWLQGLREGIKLDVHVLEVLLDFLALGLLLLGEGLLGLLLLL